MSEKSLQLAVKIREAFRTGKARLPVLPEAVMKVRNIANDESKGAADVAKVISNDASFSTTILRLANSARFNVSGREIRNLPMAVQRLGMRRTLQLLIAISSKIHMEIKNPAMQDIMGNASNHALMVATASQHLARLVRGANPDEAFLAGLLHNVGVSAVISAAEKELAACEQEERLEIIQGLYREMGGRLLAFWQIPGVFAAVSAHHGLESDDRPLEKLIDYVDTANFLIQKSGHIPRFGIIANLDDVTKYPPFMRLGATETHLAAVEIELEDGLAELQEVFTKTT